MRCRLNATVSIVNIESGEQEAVDALEPRNAQALEHELGLHLEKELGPEAERQREKDGLDVVLLGDEDRLSQVI